ADILDLVVELQILERRDVLFRVAPLTLLFFHGRRTSEHPAASIAGEEKKKAPRPQVPGLLLSSREREKKGPRTRLRGEVRCARAPFGPGAGERMPRSRALTRVRCAGFSVRSPTCFVVSRSLRARPA